MFIRDVEGFWVNLDHIENIGIKCFPGEKTKYAVCLRTPHEDEFYWKTFDTHEKAQEWLDLQMQFRCHPMPKVKK